jgi:hypothetical protein
MVSVLRTGATVAIAVLTLGVGARAQAPAPMRIDVSKLGPQVGERVPDFILEDQWGVRRTLQSIMGRRGAVLVFVRSADW